MIHSRWARLASLTAAAAIVVSGTAMSVSAQSPSAPESGASTCAGSGSSDTVQIPDVEEGKFNVAMVLIGPTTMAAGARRTTRACQYVCENVPDTHIAYIENVPEGADSEQVFRSLARKGFDLIYGTSFG